MASGDLTTLRIKNMVCNRCIRVVREELARLKVPIRSIALGEVIVEGGVPTEAVRSALERNGFELIEDKRLATIERIKRAIVEYVRRDPETAGRKLKLSTAIERSVGGEYDTLSALFSSIEQVTVERYMILQRIEFVKELLKYGELTLGEIAYRTGYSSVQHLSRQFRQVTGLTATEFKAVTAPLRIPIDRVARGR